MNLYAEDKVVGYECFPSENKVLQLSFLQTELPTRLDDLTSAGVVYQVL